MAKVKQKAKSPKLGGLVDKLWRAREEIRKEEARLKKMKADYKESVESLMGTYDRAEVEKAAGSVGQASITRRKIYRVSDQDAFLNAVRKRKAWHLLKAGLNADEFKTMLEDKPPSKGDEGTPFPGVTLFTDVSLHLTSVKGGKRGDEVELHEED